VKSFVVTAAIDCDDVTFFEDLIWGWDGVDDLFVDVCAKSCRIVVISFEGWGCVVVSDEFFGELVEFYG